MIAQSEKVRNDNHGTVSLIPSVSCSAGLDLYADAVTFPFSYRGLFAVVNCSGHPKHYTLCWKSLTLTTWLSLARQ